MTSSEQAIVDIERRAGFLLASIAQLRADFIEQVVRTRDIEMKKLSEHEKEINEFINLLHEREYKIDICGTCRRSSLDEIKLCNTCCSEAVKVKKLSEYDHICINFKPNTCTKNDVAPLYGSIENYHITRPSSFVIEESRATSPTFSVELVSEFTCSDPAGSNVHAIRPVSESEAWVSCGWSSTDIMFYDKSGNQKASLTLDIQVDHLCLTSSGDVLASSYNGTTLHKIDENLHISEFASLDFFPSGLCATNNGHIYVCGTIKLCSSMNGGQTKTSKGKHKHVITRLSSIGEIVSEIDVSPHDPHRLAVDQEGRIFFSDYGADKKRKFIVMAPTGQILKTYEGPLDINLTLDNTFYPLGVCLDRYGNLLVADWNNDCIHMLNKDGQFVRFLLTKEHGITCPNALAIDSEDQLWVGNGVGDIKVFRYVQ